MYYYIFDQIRNSRARADFEKIKEIARNFSIPGEFAQISPARSAEELVESAVDKAATTLIVIGSDTLINKVVSALIRCKSPSPIALGIISTDPESILYDRWGFKTYEDALETIKFRKLERFTIGMIEPNFYFLSSARIECSKPTRMLVEIDHYKVEGVFDRVEISNNLYVLIERFLKEKSLIKSTLNWLSGKETFDSDQSIFKGKIIRISSTEAIPVYIGSEVVTKTPINIYRKINALNIITKRDRIST
jgi:diacylglycerol kinase family enzyme